jgi:hypothetical protein
MIRRETLLWILFLIFCFGAGYFQGLSPEFRLMTYWSQLEEVRILTYSEKLTPPFLIDDIGKRTHTSIKVDVSTSFNEFLAKAVSTSSGYSLFLLPRPWSTSLSQQGLVLNLSGLKSFFLKTLHPDFPAVESRLFPWAWIPTAFAFDPDTDRKLISSVVLINDEDHIFQVLKQIDSDPALKDFNKALVDGRKVTLDLRSLFQSLPLPRDQEYREVNLLNQDETKLLQIAELWPQGLFIFDVIVPRKTPHIGTSIDLLKAFFSVKHLLLSLSEEPFGITMNSFEGLSAFPQSKKPSALRNRPIQSLLNLKNIDSSEKVQFLKRFKFTNLK